MLSSACTCNVTRLISRAARADAAISGREAVEWQAAAQPLGAIQRLGAELSQAGRVAIEAGGDSSVRLRFERDALVQPGGKNGCGLSPTLLCWRAQSPITFKYAEGRA